MAEFGENIRKAREKLGITQQTLADKLYVTRQAVSRWENGSRYPDLLTAKKLSQALDTTLDDLLADDDMRTYPEVNPVIEYPLYKRIQTALVAAAFVTNMIQLLYYTIFLIIENPLIHTHFTTAFGVRGSYTLFPFWSVLFHIKHEALQRSKLLTSFLHSAFYSCVKYV